MNKYPLNLSPDYCSDWGVQEAIRELLQNNLDDPSTFEYSYSDGELELTSIGVELPLKTLMLGCTSKRDETSSVGGFGEGYKVALLVLLREGYEVVISNGSKLWKPVFEYCPEYDSDMLYIKEDVLLGNDDLTFHISGLEDSDWEEAKERCLYLQDEESLGEVKEGTNGRVFLDKRGKLYVGGLFVKDTTLKYTYDFHPSAMKLDRDRQAVSDWDLGVQTSKLLSEVLKPEEVAHGLLNSSNDFSSYGYVPTRETSDACYEIYLKKFKGKVLATGWCDEEELKKEGYKNVTSVSPNFAKSVRENREYQEFLEGLEVKASLTPVEMLREVLDDTDWYTDTNTLSAAIKGLIRVFEERGVSWDE